MRPPDAVGSRVPSTGVRIAGYVLALVVVPLIAAGLGTSYYVERDCHGDGGAAECDLPGIGGAVWGVAAFLCTIAVVLIIEIALAGLRGRGRLQTETTTKARG